MRSSDSDEHIAFAAAAVVVVGVVAMTYALARARTPQPHPERDLGIPYASDTLKFDGELDEASWRESARSGAFRGRDGKEATPYSDARFARDEKSLRIGLYAADQDIVAAKVGPDGDVSEGDAFHVVIETGGVEHVLDVGPTCIVADGTRRGASPIDLAWPSHAALGCDSDGTINVPGDMDEEWVVEMAVPFATLGMRGIVGERATLRIRRCEVGSRGRADNGSCGEFGPVEIVLRR